MRPFSESTLRLAGTRTRLLALPGDGVPDKPTLLYFHGFSDSADSFKPLMRRMASAGLDQVSVDLPHFGQAEDLQPGLQLPQFVAFAAAALEHFAANGALVPVGQSLGGRALLMALAQAPIDAVPAALVIAPAPMELPPWQKMLVRNASLAAGVSSLSAELPLERLIAGIVQSFRRSCFADAEKIPQEVFTDYARHYSAVRVQRHIEALRQIGSELEQPLDLKTVRIPVQIVWGELDRLAPIVGAARYVDALPNAHLTRLEACGHHAHLERTDAVAEVLQQAIDAAF